MKFFKAETVGEKLDREAKEKEQAKKQAQAERLKKQNSDKGLHWGVNDIKPENYSEVLIQQNECIIQLLGVLCSGQNNISGTAAVAVMSMYKERLNKIEN